MQTAAGDAGNGDVEVVGQAGLQRTIELDRWILILESLPQLIPQGSEMRLATLLILQRQFRCCSHAHDQRHRQGSRTQPLFLASAPLQGLQRCALSDDQSADAFRTVELVSAETDQITAQLLCPQRQVAVGLGRIGMHGDALTGADGAQLLDRLDHPDLIVGHHHAHQLGVGLDGLLQLLHLDQTIALRG